MTDKASPEAEAFSGIRVQGAAEHNLADVDVTLGSGLTAVVGVSGSGKSSLVIDVLHNEARRRLFAALSMSSPWSRVKPARVRAISGLAPAVAVSQDSVIRNPLSTVATATGIHPFLRLLYARFAARICPTCGEAIEVLSAEERLVRARRLLSQDEQAQLVIPLLTGVGGSHTRLLSALARRYGPDAIELDGRPWEGQAADPSGSHSIALTRQLGATDAATLRAVLAEGDLLGSPLSLLRLNGKTYPLARAPICAGCGTRVTPARPTDFRKDSPASGNYLLHGLTLEELLASPAIAITALLDSLDLGTAANRPVEEIRRRLKALAGVGLGYLSLDRASPTLSRGESQRMRLAVLLSNRVEDVIHILDEPTIGLDAASVQNLLDQLTHLRGPVIMVEHDRDAIAAADDVVELGPGGGIDGGRVIFQGPPAALWRADTGSGRLYSRLQARSRRRSQAAGDSISIKAAGLRNLRGFDCSFPIGRLTVVTGPSGAGKTTLVRDVLVSSLQAKAAIGCAELCGPRLRAILVDQSPIGRNPRSNPATYTGLATVLRDRFASASGLPPSVFSFNRPEGACPSCGGMGAIEITSRFLTPTWLTCGACDGLRFGSDTLAIRIPLGPAKLTIADVYELTVDEARQALAENARARKILRALAALGLGYLSLGQPSPSLSGGEAQRVKLARRMAITNKSDVLVVDEPTTGLHPADLDRLLLVLRQAADRGVTVIAVEHHPQVVESADWVIRLGPGAGPEGGRLMHEGLVEPRPAAQTRPRSEPRRRPRASPKIRIRGATAHNLKNLSVDIRKNALTVFVGVSGSGKSSLLVDVIQAEASRRLLECLSMYERQSVKEGPEAPVRELSGLGPAVFITPVRPMGRRSTVGTASEISFQLAVLLTYLGERCCDRCRHHQTRRHDQAGTVWGCPTCGAETAPVEPHHFLPSSYQAACPGCSGLGTVGQARVERLIVQPNAPVCGGAMYSPGFFPSGYLCKPGNGGFDMLQALAIRHGFDPFTTPWIDMPEPAKRAFLFGDTESMEVEFRTRVRTSTRTATWSGIFPIIEGWDVGGLYTEHVVCEACNGGRLRPEFLAVRFAGHNRHALHTMSLYELERLLSRELPESPLESVSYALQAVRARVRFLIRVGLGYVHLDRMASTLSAGEAQRLKLAALLGGSLVGMTVLLDEPSRGLHPEEVGALADELVALTHQGNTVLAVEHDPELIARADEVIVLGPAAGTAGGHMVARGSPQQLSRSEHSWALGAFSASRRARRDPTAWMTVQRPTENNLVGGDVVVPLGILVGLCGVSGSGKSTLAIDTIGRALDPPRVTTSVAYERIDPGRHDGIEGAPGRTLVVDQSTQGVTSPGVLTGASVGLRAAFSQSDAALAAGMSEKQLAPGCDACHGRGMISEDMGFLPKLRRPCDACAGTGYTAEVRELRVRGRSLSETEALTISEALREWGDVEAIARPLVTAEELGLGHLALRQPAWSLSGGELQRLKLVKELMRAGSNLSLFILDEPTVGQHVRDVINLIAVLDRLVERGNTVLVVDHHPGLLAACDWLIELGPGGGPNGGRVVASGTPEILSTGTTPTASHLRQVLP